MTEPVRARRPIAEWAGRAAVLGPSAWVELFALANLAFLAVDIALAHAVNRFAHPAEWVPLAFSLAAPPVLLAALWLGGLAPAWVREPGARGWARGVGLAVGGLSIAVGIAGLVLHLESHFFGAQTLANLVYTAPFAAPLAYAGVGFLLVLNRMVDPVSEEWARWVLILALGGFLGNFVLTLADHAQNGFFEATEWIGVAAAAYAVGALLAAAAWPRDRAARRLCAAVMGAQVVVGLVGFALHLAANLSSESTGLRDRFIYGAPVFAPLLFADLAMLGGLGLWSLHLASPPAEEPDLAAAS